MTLLNQRKADPELNRSLPEQAEPATHGQNQGPVIQSVDRALDVLEELAKDGTSSSLALLAERTGLPGPTVHRILRTLASRGYVIKTARGEYSIGGAFFALTTTAGRSVGAALQDILDRLSQATGESVAVAMLDADEALYIAHRTSTQSMRQFTQVGNRVCLHATGVGKVLLASMDSEHRTFLLHHMKLPVFTSHTLANRGELQAEIEQIASHGYAIDNEEQELGVRCMAMGIPGNSLFAASVSGPPSRMNAEHMTHVILPALMSAAEEIAATLTVTQA